MSLNSRPQVIQSLGHKQGANSTAHWWLLAAGPRVGEWELLLSGMQAPPVLMLSRDSLSLWLWLQVFEGQSLNCHTEVVPTQVFNKASLVVFTDLKQIGRKVRNCSSSFCWERKRPRNSQGHTSVTPLSCRQWEKMHTKRPVSPSAASGTETEGLPASNRRIFPKTIDKKTSELF